MLLMYTSAPSSVEMSLVNKTTSSICICWSEVSGVMSGLILSIKNGTFNEGLIISHQELRSASLLSAIVQILKLCETRNKIIDHSGAAVAQEVERVVHIMIPKLVLMAAP